MLQKASKEMNWAWVNWIVTGSFQRLSTIIFSHAHTLTHTPLKILSSLTVWSKQTLLLSYSQLKFLSRLKLT